MKFERFVILLLLCLIYSITNAQVVTKPWTGRGIKPLIQFTIASLDNKWGLIDDNGKVFLPFIYDSINYEYVFLFKIYKSGKVGLASQGDCVNDVDSEGKCKVLVIEPVYDSLQRGLGYVKVYKDSLMALAWYDGSILFPFSTIKKVCAVMFGSRSFENRRRFINADARNKKIVAKDSSYAQYNEHLIYFHEKFYRFESATDPHSSSSLVATEVKLTKYFKKEFKDKKGINLICDASK